jgi:cysteinyl-tRNA synthetase
MREVRIRDTLSGELRSLETGSEVGIYACGPTVYSRIHIGNARPFVVFSLFARFLRSEGYRPKLVVNVTDINDKIYVAARAADKGSAEFAAAMTAAYIEDTDRLGVGRPHLEPLASETVDGIVSLIAELVEGGHAYEAGGDVYFRVRSFDDYGKLSNRRPEDMDQGEDAGSASLKEDRSDLVFPHHENEIAQSEGAGRPFAKIWMHNGMIETDAAKMSKSEGNIFQLSTALDAYGREAVVAYLISGHYRQPLAFGEGQMEEAVARVERLRNFFRDNPLGASGGDSAGKQRGGPGESPPEAQNAAVARAGAFRDALADDFNTPKALAEVFELVGEANRGEVDGGDAAVALAEMLELVGLSTLTQPEKGAEGDERAQELMEEREQARAAKDFARADELRDELAGMGWTVRDSAEGPSLVPKT